MAYTLAGVWHARDNRVVALLLLACRDTEEEKQVDFLAGLLGMKKVSACQKERPGLHSFCCPWRHSGLSLA
eukprot:1139201-Pelagomonas_calceolata.AAC.5